MEEKELEKNIREIKHNIFNYLTTIKGQISLLKLKEDFSEKGNERCKKISDSCLKIEEELKKIDEIFKE